MTATLLDLPPELLIAIADKLQKESDLNALVQTCHHLHGILDLQLYRGNVQQYGSSALVWAAQFGRLATAQKMLAAGAYPCIPPEREVANLGGFSPLMISIFHGRDRMARMLIEHGADIRERCLTGYDEFTTLHMAVMVRSAGIVELLLEKGVDVEGQDASMQTPLHWAMVKAGWQSAETGDRDWMRIVRALLRNGANVESQDIQGRTPRDVATPHQSRILDQLLHENMEHEPS